MNHIQELPKNLREYRAKVDKAFQDFVEARRVIREKPNTSVEQARDLERAKAFYVERVKSIRREHGITSSEY
jgi:hypothetical protein